MRPEPQASAYRPDPRIEALAQWIADPVEPADFPKHVLRFRNDRWAGAIGLESLTDGQWIEHFGKLNPLPAIYRSRATGDDDLWQDDTPPTLVIDEVERVWFAIDRDDDWRELDRKVAEIRRLGDALGAGPQRLC